ncbi:hypothetical protein CLAFUW4_06941 [Fulvia fulva]|uniref:ORC6 first cyclin-like domain-containing protein n=1 Tax=Passalora fulva TaxID=5499 RepID=A0A9Q8PA09_PASFU|nr:uncharacterized protein CLAFUR5_07078 [Fulvia fulva]KAK4621571.1 hypothetical protein CLAFUR4_06950 [Fulvia fulva]KAK4623140.1 hypothetical protein CLAFUR0_06948 [Fulvia fulva]UJO18634.1 hypothetical protein CLAFUR5_07078 [Fulvia fulva]WPV16241.1 hypothetical protein CLAFUW4_06941 [Fulvia fulva]WPV30967.1 hypothetical protein CLAFUW7_06941 [Fulvia fulva]
MPTPVELALSSLLPTIAYLPPDLIALASSLLSQSRAKAASLKPEEEIGRTYACAHIACNRSAKRLDLEVGKPAPPVKPRVYDKLYKYLDSALTTTRQQNAPRTPQTNRVKDVPTSGGKSTGKSSYVTAKDTLTKTPLNDAIRMPRVGSKRKHDEAERDDDVPDLAMPLVRAICKVGGISSAVPHIMVGAAAAVREIASRANKSKSDPPSKRRRKTPQSAKSTTSQKAEETKAASGVAPSRWPALLVALYCFTAAKMRALSPEDAEHEALRRTAIDAAKTCCKDKGDTIPDEVTTGLNKLDSNVRFYALEAEDCGWLEMDWYHNVPEGQAGDQDEFEVPESDADENDEDDAITPRKKPYKTPLRRKEKHGGKLAVDDEDEVGPSGLLPGLATMFQSSIDWLSDERRADFALWKRGIVKEITAIEAKG